MSRVERIDADEAVERIAALGPARVFLQGGCGEPLALTQAWARAPEAAAALTFCGVMIPGANTFDYAALHPQTRFEAFLLTPSISNAVTRGQARLSPLHYSEVWRRLQQTPFEVGIFHVSPPRADGTCSFGLCGDTAEAALPRTRYKIALINRAMPFVANAPHIPLEVFDAKVECGHALVEMETAQPTADAAAIAEHVAGLVLDGAVIQTGIGRLPSTVLSSLRDRRGLRLYSGLIGQAHLDLLDAGCFKDELGALTAGVALGDAAFYERMSQETRLRIASIAHTHDHATLAKLPRFTAINAALEIDLFGQINAEYAGGKQIACVGGLVDFVRGAHAAPDGRAIVMISARGKDGGSRIVPRLSAPSVTMSKADAPILVTEYGAADLRHLDLEARAAAITALAAPEHRSALAARWRGGETA